MMWSSFENWTSLYNQVMEYKDPRLDGYPMMDSPLPMLISILIYLLFVSQGSKWMRKREPFELKRTIFIYNCCMVLLSAYIVFWGVILMLTFGYSIYCTNWITYYVPEGCPYRHWILTAGWLNFISKIIELSDTVFFILRKKFNLVTFLHVYHHAFTVVIIWIGINFVPGGPMLLIPILNAMVHVFMYSYYALTSIGVNMDRWKRYMTIIQLVQFVVFIVLCTLYQLYDCPIAKVFGVMTLAYIVTLMILFINFYIKAYVIVDKSKLSRNKNVDKNK